MRNTPGLVSGEETGNASSVPPMFGMHFPIDSFAKRCLLDGVDDLSHMLNQEAAVAAYDAKHPARSIPLPGVGATSCRAQLA
jgi:hypothetical protein